MKFPVLRKQVVPAEAFNGDVPDAHIGLSKRVSVAY